MDSGATENMTNMRRWFHEYEKFDELKSIKLGNEMIIDAVSKGNIYVKIANSNTGYLQGALHVPELKINLFSARRIIKKGFM